MAGFTHQERDSLSYWRTIQLFKYSGCCTMLHSSLYAHSIQSDGRQCRDPRYSILPRIKFSGSAVNIVYLPRCHCRSLPTFCHSYSVWCHCAHLIYIGLRLLSMDQFRIIDKNKEKFCKQKQKKYCLKLLALVSSRQTNFANLTHWQLLKKKFLNFAAGPIIALGCHDRTTILPSVQHMHNRGQWMFTRVVIYYIL